MILEEKLKEIKRMGVRDYDTYTEDSEFPFGRYKGKTLGEIARVDKEYINWFFKEFDLSAAWWWSEDIDFQASITREMNDIISEKNMFLGYYQEKIEREKEEKIEERKQYRKIPDIGYNPYEENDGLDWLRDAAGTDDPDVMNDVYWNLD